jgi:hypothetical protein
MEGKMFRVVVSLDGPVKEVEFKQTVAEPASSTERDVSFVDALGVKRVFNSDHVVCITYYPVQEAG